MKRIKKLTAVLITILILLSCVACSSSSDKWDPGEALSRDPDTWSDQDKKEINSFFKWLDDND
ncbi:MAG: hypothetical protein ACI39F_01090 [Acutalibacteraceae bacterium]